VTAVRPPSRFGELTLEGERVAHFEEKPQMAMGFINGGFFVFQRGLLDYLALEATCDFEFGPLQRLAADNQLRAYRHEGFWQCMDTVREREYLDGLYASGKAAWKIW
jgi:glucose-1-phosphate cytidylyltransferase